MSAIDPGLDDPKRDDGEKLLRKLRVVWRSLARGDNSYLLEPGATGSIASMLGQGATGMECILPSLLDSKATPKPVCRLVAPSTTVLLPETMDMNMTTEQRAATIPVRGERGCAVLGLPHELRPQAKIVVIFPKDEFSSGAKQDAEMEITRTGMNVSINMVAFNGARNRIKGSVQDVCMLDRAFDTTDLIIVSDRDLLPSLPNEIPGSIMEEISDFWQTSLRAHVLAAACQPCEHTSSRFLAFSRMTVGTVGRDSATKRVVVRATLHPSSSECICGAHGLKPMAQQFPKSKFTNSKVELTLSMCGRRLQRPSRSMDFGVCPLHQGNTPRVSAFPDMCCHGTTCEVSCAHFTDKREFKPGLWIRDIPLDKSDVLHVQSLIAAAVRCTEEVNPMIGKRKRDEIKECCSTHSQALSANLEQVNRFKSCRPVIHGAEELMRMDWKATDMLRERKVRQWRRQSTKELVLAGPREGSSGLAPLVKPESDLNHHHLWLFKPPPRY